VLSRFLSAIMIRTYAQSEVDEFAEHASVPVINGLTDRAHPLQALADVMTVRERFGAVHGVKVAYLGDGNNVCHSLMRIAGRLGMTLVVATPAGYRPDEAVTLASQEDAAATGGSITLTDDAAAAVGGAHVLYTDVWTSMGQEAEREARQRDLSPFRIDEAALAAADAEAVVLHCLPAHVGEEISEGVLYGPQSLVWDQAENRLHTQKAVMALVIR
jgi:ornithine carbamoyltransferase